MRFFDKHIIRIIYQKKPNFKTLLDVGCQNGVFIKSLNECFPDRKLIGLDVHNLKTSKTILTEIEGKKFYKINNNINENWKISDGSVDIITSNMVLEHVRDIDHFASNVNRILKPSGIAIHVAPTKESLWEGHIKQPLTHLFPNKLWIKFMSNLGFKKSLKKRSIDDWEKILKNEIHYRTLFELENILSSSSEFNTAALFKKILNLDLYSNSVEIPGIKFLMPITFFHKKK